MKRRLALISLLFLPVLAQCQPEKKEPAPAEKPTAATVEKSPKVRMKTNLGTIVIQLNAEKAPITTANFLSYVNKKHYDGTVFHRVIKDFMIQGGGFALSGGRLTEKATGSGITNESTNGLKNERGSISMARTSDPNSATAQFFINTVDNANLNYPSMGGYAVFGKVIEGMDVVDKIRAVETGPSGMFRSDVPQTPVVIESATAE